MDNITVSDLELNGTGLFLNVSWLPPTKPFGEIQKYQVRVGVVPLSSEEQEGDITSSSHVNFTVRSDKIIIIMVIYTYNGTFVINSRTVLPLCSRQKSFMLMMKFFVYMFRYVYLRVYYFKAINSL